MSLMNLRSANRAVAGGGPGPEGNITKLVLSENGHEAVVKLLLDSSKVDADAEDSEYDRTPLSWAILTGHKAIVELLLGGPSRANHRGAM